MPDPQPKKLPYHIRPMDRRDIPVVIDLAMRAFDGDELDEWLFPKRREFPLSFRATRSALFRERMVKIGTWPMLCVPSPHAYDHDKIMGLAIWERFPGTSKPESTDAEKKEAREKDIWYQKNSGWMAAFERKLCQIEKKWDAVLQLNPAIDYKALHNFITGGGDDEKVFGPIYANVCHWHLMVLVVDPQYWRRGVGTALVKWGVDLAEEESKSYDYSVPLTLTASAAGSKMYPRLGFKCVDWIIVPELEASAEGGPAFIFDPKETWIENAPEGSMVDGKKIDVVWTKRALEMLEKK